MMEIIITVLVVLAVENRKRLLPMLIEYARKFKDGKSNDSAQWRPYESCPKCHAKLNDNLQLCDYVCPECGNNLIRNPSETYIRRVVDGKVETKKLE